ncbi:uncharacterized protein [Drosophila kikkawai]|uniref:Uncharacterized protein isoform X2 n=1 Tax=Drosophila kikkawai TaxID=30033 RepID=A0ABM4G9S2_DROKI
MSQKNSFGQDFANSSEHQTWLDSLWRVIEYAQPCIEEVTSGGVGVIRVAMVRTATGLIKRAVAKLAALPIDSEIVGTVPLPTGGVCSEQTAST